MTGITKEVREVTFFKKTCDVCKREFSGRTEAQLNYLYEAHMISHKNKNETETESKTETKRG